MNTWLGWGLALIGGVVGYVSYGWRGIVLALTVVVFWLLLQFSRALRALRDASGRPVGLVPNVVMFQARLRTGMRLPQVLRLTRSLGRKVTDEPETYVWADASGDEVQVELHAGRVARWVLNRAAAGAGEREPGA